MATSFNPDTLYAFYKKARNLLRKFEPGSVTGHILNALHQAHTGGVEVLRHYQPWNLLLALKWAIQETDTTAHRRPAATLNDVHRVLNIIHDMEAHVRMPSEFGHVTLFMRHMAFQQFWLHPPDGSALVRQDILFAELPTGHAFQREFLELTGLTVADSTELSFALLVAFLSGSDPRVINRADFANIEPRLSVGALDRFLRHLSRTPTQLRTLLNEAPIRQVSVSDQFILPSPFLRAPLLNAERRFFVYHPPLLFRALEELAYRTLRSKDPEWFAQRFGPIFEQHVARCLADAGITAVPEEKLKTSLAGSGKCVDFLIVENDCNVLIDAKGVEMSTVGRVSHEAEIVYRAVKDSAMKAIVQGMDTVRRVRGTASERIPFGTQENYLLVVTFEPLHLGPSNELGALFGSQLTRRLHRDFGEPLPFPLENVFFCSIGELERLLARIRAGGTKLLAALRFAKQSDSDRKTRKFDFGQHVQELGPPADRLPFLEAALDRLCERCIQRLPPELRRAVK